MGEEGAEVFEKGTIVEPACVIQEAMKVGRGEGPVFAVVVEGEYGVVGVAGIEPV